MAASTLFLRTDERRDVGEDDIVGLMFAFYWKIIEVGDTAAEVCLTLIRNLLFRYVPILIPEAPKPGMVFGLDAYLFSGLPFGHRNR